MTEIFGYVSDSNGGGRGGVRGNSSNGGGYDGSERRMVDITRDKPIKVAVRVQVPVRDHPKVRAHLSLPNVILYYTRNNIRENVLFHERNKFYSS